MQFVRKWTVEESLMPSEINSMQIPVANTKTRNHILTFIYYLRDQNRVTFRERDCVRLSQEHSEHTHTPASAWYIYNLAHQYN